VIPAERLPLVDDFADDQPGGRVIGTATRTGHRRFGSDVEGVLSVDHGALRIKPLVRPEWGRAAIAYGPFVPRDGLVASVVLTNGRNGSEDLERWPSPLHWLAQHVRGTQSDSPLRRAIDSPMFRGRDALHRRVRAARYDAGKHDARRSAANLAFGWSTSATPPAPDSHTSLVVRSTGPENAELCLGGSGRLQAVTPVAELPMRLALAFDGARMIHSWSVDDGTGHWPNLRALGTTAVDPERPGWFVLQQRVLGQVGWGMDTRLREIRIGDLEPVGEPLDSGPPDPGCETTSALRPVHGTVVLDDDFDDGDDPAHAELHGRRIGRAAWRKVFGERSIIVSGGTAQVEAPRAVRRDMPRRLLRPSGQRTMYVVDWDGSPGAIETEIVPPGTGRGEGERGRAGLVLWQDPDNFLIINDWLDDQYPGASVSAFRRLDGFEEVYDAVWVNVGDRIRWGSRHLLAVGFDRFGFTASLDGIPVLHREFADVYPRYPTLDVRGVGICANWEFGDDTGSRFTRFSARRQVGSAIRWMTAQSIPG
jgi:hypothetical protein